MKFLRCLLCRGEVDIIGGGFSVNKKVKCRQCNFSNFNDEVKSPEIVFLKKRDKNNQD